MIQLDENYSADNDSTCWTLTYEAFGPINAKTGKPSHTRRHTFHHNFKGVLLAYKNGALKPAENWVGLIALLEKTENKITDLNTKAEQVFRLMANTAFKKFISVALELQEEREGVLNTNCDLIDFIANYGVSKSELQESLELAKKLFTNESYEDAF